MIWFLICVILLIWYLVIILIANNGFLEILFNYKTQKFLSLSPDQYEPVSILRPIKGIDPELETCLECSFQQNYPKDKIEIIFCIDDPNDESIPIINKLIHKYRDMDAKIMITETDEYGNSVDHYGPNPKVNNLAKGFQKAKYDILWIMDSNVWGHSNILINSIKTLTHNLVGGSKKNRGSRRVKLVHHVPLAVSINKSSIFNKIGIKLDEIFLFSSHSKFYVSLNKLNPAPCVNGKSNIYRKLDLEAAVSKIPFEDNAFFDDVKVKQDAKLLISKGPGNSLKFFSKYIGEDNMIAIALWEFLYSRTSLSTDIVIQPLNQSENSQLGILQFFKRRMRWLRVRKYMVYSATLIEPTTESIVNGIFGTLSVSYLFFDKFFIKKFFFINLLIWYLTDMYQYNLFMTRIQENNHPFWFSYESDVVEWTLVWVLRECFAFPIWLMAMLGHEIDWRGKPFKIKPDLTAEEL